jgi:hypothetical protein
MVTPVVEWKAVALLNPNAFAAPHKFRLELATWKNDYNKVTRTQGDYRGSAGSRNPVS